MENQYETSWTNEEFVTYLLLFCSRADFEQGEEEIEKIQSKCSKETFRKMQREINKDNDFRSIEKISNTYHRLGYSDKREELIASIKRLFAVDDNFDIQERNLLLGLKRILD